MDIWQQCLVLLLSVVKLGEKGLKILGAEIIKCVEILSILMYLKDPKSRPTVGVVQVCLFQATETRLMIKKYVNDNET